MLNRTADSTGAMQPPDLPGLEEATPLKLVKLEYRGC